MWGQAKARDQGFTKVASSEAHAVGLEDDDLDPGTPKKVEGSSAAWFLSCTAACSMQGTLSWLASVRLIVHN